MTILSVMLFYCKNYSNYFSSNKWRYIIIICHGFSISSSKHIGKENLFCFYFILLYFYYFHNHRCPHFSSLCPLPLTLNTPLSSGHHHTVVCVYGLRIYVLWLLSSSLPPTSSLTPVSLFGVFMPLLLFCSSVYFVY